MSGGVADVDRSLGPASSLQTNLVNLSAGFCAFTVVVYQAWFMPFSLPLFTGRDGYLRLALYALYGVVLIVSFAVVVTRRDVRKAISPLAIGAVVAVVPIALHPLGIVNRSYLTTLALGGSALTLMLTFAPPIVLRLSASVTALNAIVCFLDVLFTHGFTTTVGRAAGLAVNPNVAAAGLLLGGAASYRAVPKEWRPGFLVLVGGALSITLSRSTILAAVATVFLPSAAGIWQYYRAGRRLRIDTAAWTRALAVALVLLSATFVALTTNRYFRAAISQSFAGVLAVNTDLSEAGEAVDTSLARPAVPIGHPPQTDDARPLSVEPPRLAPSRNVPALPEESLPGDVATPPKAIPSAAGAARIQALSERLRGEGKKNSISARALFLERGLLAYQTGGFFGRGLEEAHVFVPHNTFVLFAIAFGHIGWLVPLGFLVSAFWFVRDAEDLPLGVALLGVMLTSHDVLLTPSLFIPVAIGIGSMLAAKTNPSRSREAYSSFAFGIGGGVGLFAAASIVLLISPPIGVDLRANPLYFMLLGTVIAWAVATLYLFCRSRRSGPGA
ncbi:hypothetical protein EN745_02130 [Mesorhizobium sp. M4A.F.Ca.ET.022.05.2.1]|uniref:O-antigen ligase family protein n=1 Tax=Mesorhizobium sp. M4A.F.Ca.ET.022.05.2.1 TaxID=2496653 RepID=UPI000FCB7A06|nr:O-antigen ligase family protein [Mesorhizobium sp. M4A.F.Ca.ET.022.05.2.1]RVC83563.1 hypothetical protein EN745_02130 [Mesorhizobium sp. M4A.F.Ca.ET.022.05.2.1]